METKNINTVLTFCQRCHLTWQNCASIKLSDAAADYELKTNCEKFDSELELRTPDGLADWCVSSVIAFWSGTEKLAS